MPTTITGLLIIVFAILPGLVAYYIYAMFLGSDWRITEIEKISRIILFSVIGLFFYVIFASIFKLQQPIYVVPETFETKFSTDTLSQIAFPYFGHFFFSALIAWLAGFLPQKISKTASITLFPSVWDVFVHQYISHHWVIVKTTNGEAYLGILTAECSVSSAERDIVLKEPALHQNDNNYCVLPYQHIFIPASLVSTVATLYDKDIDKERLTTIGEISSIV
jgi:hypothetical protein